MRIRGMESNSPSGYAEAFHARKLVVAKHCVNEDRMNMAPKPAATAADPGAKDFSKSRALQPKAHDLIPGGSHTYAKGDDQFPEQSPGFMARGKGCHVWDVDGNEFIEYGMGLRSVTLGHAYRAGG